MFLMVYVGLKYRFMGYFMLFYTITKEGSYLDNRIDPWTLSVVIRVDRIDGHMFLIFMRVSRIFPLVVL
jgi:hypothetical protein